jgi:hypothetical protein
MEGEEIIILRIVGFGLYNWDWKFEIQNKDFKLLWIFQIRNTKENKIIIIKTEGLPCTWAKTFLHSPILFSAARSCGPLPGPPPLLCPLIQPPTRMEAPTRGPRMSADAWHTLDPTETDRWDPSPAAQTRHWRVGRGYQPICASPSQLELMTCGTLLLVSSLQRNSAAK